ncbi:MAG: hypothetical protein ACK42Z_07500, partial [Candidatus Kapaibacteriota bacterium]
MKRIIFLFFLITFLSHSKDTPFNFLRQTGSARASALGGAFVSIYDDPTALFYNPASVGSTISKNFSFTFFKHVLDINSGSVTFKKDFEKIGYFALSGNFTNYGSFERTNIDGQVVGSFTANDFSFGLTYS